MKWKNSTWTENAFWNVLPRRRQCSWSRADWWCRLLPCFLDCVSVHMSVRVRVSVPRTTSSRKCTFYRLWILNRSVFGNAWNLMTNIHLHEITGDQASSLTVRKHLHTLTIIVIRHSTNAIELIFHFDKFNRTNQRPVVCCWYSCHYGYSQCLCVVLAINDNCPNGLNGRNGITSWDITS